jgi:hypothetical protein
VRPCLITGRKEGREGGKKGEKGKKQPTESKKKFANYLSDKVLVSTTYKTLYCNNST